MKNIKEYFRNKNIIITGGLGFLGSNIVNKLVKLSANVVIVDNLNPLYGGNLFNIRDIKDKVKLFIDSARNEDIMFPLISEADLIFHFAAQVSYIDSLSFPYKDLELNSKMTLEILELCRKFNPKIKIIFSSSRMVLGKIKTEKMTEETPANPLNLYGIHKLTSEKYLQMYYNDFGIKSVICRITNPYGIRQQIKHSKYSLVGWFIRQAIEGNVIKIFGDGEQLRDYIFSEDIANAFILSAATEELSGEIVNVGSGVSTRFKDMVKSVIDVVGKGKIEFVEWPKNYENIETGDIRTDISKLQNATGWEPKFSLNQGIQETAKFYERYLLNYIGIGR